MMVKRESIYGVLYGLTWLNDDILPCKETKIGARISIPSPYHLPVRPRIYVDILRDVFVNSFHFETDHFQIPSEK